MLATAGLMALARTQSTPAMMPLIEPLPAQSSTRTPRSAEDLARPYVAPPMVPATWVPWPLQSWPLPPNASYTFCARPPKSACEVAMPVSMTYARTPLPVPAYV